MKYIFVALTACLSIMALTKSRPMVELEPYRYGIDKCALIHCLIRLYDGFCKTVASICDKDDLNCRLRESVWRLWSWAKLSECINCKRLGQVAICASSCPVVNCNSTVISCGLNNYYGTCHVHKDLCELKRAACANTEIAHVDMIRCENAGLHQIGATGKC